GHSAGGFRIELFRIEAADFPEPFDPPGRQLLIGADQTPLRRIDRGEVTPVVRDDDSNPFIEPRRDCAYKKPEAAEPVTQLYVRQLVRGDNRIDAARRQLQRHVEPDGAA